MPRPEVRQITFTIDGREVSAPENEMLADAAKRGDVEIPVFCYEPKLGQPVGACRMCLVEVEGIPKLQTGCSTGVKDGMVVHTQSDRVKDAQRSVVEFLLTNHPLDCPVCDKGGECPLQDITFGWGPGNSRFIEPKRHFVKPLELSPLVAIDRERCILCYRCVRFSQEVSEDYQLVLVERGAESYVATFDGHPYVAPFTGNITELCPVGALTSIPYRFRARPWDIEQSGSVCNLCPSQCNVSLTVRDDKVMRVLERQNEHVDDGWLCDKGRYSFQSIHSDQRITQPLIRDGGVLRETTWERALEAAVAGLRKAGTKTAALAGGGATNEEGYLLQRLVREVLGGRDLDSTLAGGTSLALRRELARPELQATVPDIEFAHTVLVIGCDPVDSMAAVDLRIRKGARRQGVKLIVANDRPGSLDGRAELLARYAPGSDEAFLKAVGAALVGDTAEANTLATAAGASTQAVTGIAELLRENGSDVVIVWGEQLSSSARGEQAITALLQLADQLKLAGTVGAGLLELPISANSRGLREVGVLPVAGPGYSEPAHPGRRAHEIALALVEGDLEAIYLLDTDPYRALPEADLWQQALAGANTVIAHAHSLSPALEATATIVFPTEAYPEKSGTITHPDGRLQRLRPAIGRVDGVRAEWQLLAELQVRLGNDPGLGTAGEATAATLAAVSFYNGIDRDEIGGRGVRWQEEPAASALPASNLSLPSEFGGAPSAPSPNGRLRLGTFRSLWASPQVETSPALEFAVATQKIELSPEDARRLQIAHGEPVQLEHEGGIVITGTAELREVVPAGTVYAAAGLRADSANELQQLEPLMVSVSKPPEPELIAVGADDTELENRSSQPNEPEGEPAE